MAESLKKEYFLLKLKWKNFRKKLKGQDAYSKNQFRMFREAKTGDVFLGKMPLNDRELYDVPDGHRHRPYLVIEKRDDHLLCLAGSHKQREEISTYFVTKIPDFGTYGDTSYFNYGDPVELPIENINRKITAFDEDVMKKLKRIVTVYENNGNEAVKLESIPLTYKFSDVIAHDSKYYIVYSVKDNIISAYQLSYQWIRNGFMIYVKSVPMYVDLYHSVTFKPSESLMLIAVLPMKNSSAFYRYLQRKEIVKNDIVQIDNEYYLVDHVEKEDIHVYLLDKNRHRSEKEIKIKKETYYLHKDRLYTFSGFKRDIVIDNISDIRVSRKQSEEKKKKSTSAKNRKPKQAKKQAEIREN